MADRLLIVAVVALAVMTVLTALGSEIKRALVEVGERTGWLR
jgi:Flp pilus assembly pilin Flp